MPLDPSIILSGRPARIRSPFEIADQITELQARREQTEVRRLAAEEARAKAKLRAQVGQAYQQSVTVDPTTNRPTVDWGKFWSLAPAEAAPEILTEMHSAEANQLDVETKTLALNAAREKVLGGAGQAVVAGKGAPSLWQSRLLALRRLKALDEPTYQAYSQITDPQDILQAAQSWVQNAGGEAAKPQLVEYVNAKGDTVKGWKLPTVGEEYVQPPSTTGAGYRWAIPPGGTVPRLMSAEEIRTTGATAPPPNVLPSYQWATPPGATAPALMTPEEIRGARATSPTAGGAAKLTGVQQEDLATMLTVEQLVKDVEAIATAHGGLPGVGPIEGRFFPSARGSGGEVGERTRNLVGNIQGTIAKLRGGASFTPSEQAMLDRYTPTTTDTDAAIRTKLKTLTEFIQKKRENTLRVAAGEYTLPEEKSTSKAGPPKDPLGIR